MLYILYSVCLALIYYLGYILSLYSSSAYLDSEEVENLAEARTGFRGKYLRLLVDNPRISIQMAVLFKSFCLILISLIGVLGGISLSETIPLPSAVMVALILAILWFLYLAFMEYLPRRKVLGAPGVRFVKYLPLFVVVYTLFRPFLAIYTRLLSRNGFETITEEQREDIIERAIETLAEQSGVDEPLVEEEEMEMIGQILQLDATEVREVMVPRIDIKGIEKNTALDEIKQITKESGFSRYPVYEENIDKVIGILYVKDLFTDTAVEHGSFDLTRAMRKPYFIPETKIISDLMSEFKATKTHIAIVADEYGGTAGLVTLEDILEEIVGEIQDEHDSEKAPLIRLPDNSYRVNAALPVEDFIEELSLDYETREFETIGGLIYDLVGSVPSEGAILRWRDIIFEVEAVEGQRIVSVKAWLKKGTEV